MPSCTPTSSVPISTSPCPGPSLSSPFKPSFTICHICLLWPKTNGSTTKFISNGAGIGTKPFVGLKLWNQSEHSLSSVHPPDWIVNGKASNSNTDIESLKKFIPIKSPAQFTLLTDQTLSPCSNFIVVTSLIDKILNLEVREPVFQVTSLFFWTVM